MSEVTLMIHGRTYGVGCDEGQEKRVRELGQYIDRRVKEIASAGGAATEAHLIVLSALVLADELFEAREQQSPNIRNQIAQVAEENDALRAEIAELQEHINALSTQQPQKIVERVVETQVGLDAETEQQISSAIENLAGRLETIAKRLQAA